MGSYGRLAARALDTDVPVMVKLAELSKSAKDAVPLGQLSQENKLSKSSVMVTAGSNQGFLNLVLSLCDVADSVVLFAPYFFNAYMSFKMTGINNILVGPSDPMTLLPDAELKEVDRILKSFLAQRTFIVFSEWLENTLSDTKPVPKLVSIVNPGNPSGICIPEPLLKRISEICRRAGSWLLVDNAYEYFVYDGCEHSCVEGSHVVNLFSFSKAYGMMGWRVGYIAYSLEADGLLTQLLKVQDNVAICTSMISQHVALYCLESGREWVQSKVKSLERNKELLRDALSPLGEEAVKGGEGAIYLWAKLPETCLDDIEVVCWFARRHGLLLLPGSACGTSGYVRITFGMLREEECEVAAKRLRNGVEELIRDGTVE
ncbi:aromatic aminotransferase ISS1-like isoform X3 [Rhododendron vialii]|uniref:aromatic aminotransferase ISS1-like isoform X3 n=1 Tax=Rhododendron vialii TaxID=182163 RepID=UPI00265D615B|nr:aromatic aminotransferase ISS1-like isoform X3 [Rhododendron vialii]